MTKDFADLDWTAAKAENARLRERERALIDELAEANAAHDDAETRVDAALLDLHIANEALATFNARVLGLEAELAEARRALAVERANIDTLAASCEVLMEKVAKARASAHREAADAARAFFAQFRAAMDEGRSMTRTGSDLCAAIEALSATPPSGRFVADEVLRVAVVGMTQVRDCIEGGWDPHKGSPLGRAKWADAMRNVRAALAALNAGKQR